MTDASNIAAGLSIAAPDNRAALCLLHSRGEPCPDAILTLVMCSYNHGPYIGECLASIDVVVGVEKIALIVMDDGSTDDSLDIVRRFPFKSRLNVNVYGKANAGLTDSLRKGLSLVETPFVGFIASDDKYIPGSLDQTLASLAAAPTSDICWVYQAIFLDGRDGEPVYGNRMIRIIAMEPAQRVKALSVEYPKPLLLQSSVFGADILRKTEAWSDGLQLDDWPTFLKLAQESLVGKVDFRFVPEPALCRYRLHAGGVHNNLDRQLRVCLEVAHKLVAPVYRQEAISRVYSDIGLVCLNDGRFLQAGRLFLCAIAAQPSWSTVAQPARRIVSAVCKRLRRRFHFRLGRY